MTLFFAALKFEIAGTYCSVIFLLSNLQIDTPGLITLSRSIVWKLSKLHNIICISQSLTWNSIGNRFYREQSGIKLFRIFRRINIALLAIKTELWLKLFSNCFFLNNCAINHSSQSTMHNYRTKCFARKTTGIAAEEIKYQMGFSLLAG